MSNIPTFDSETVKFAIDRINETGLTASEIIENEHLTRKISDQVNQFLGNYYDRIEVEERLYIILYTIGEVA